MYGSVECKDHFWGYNKYGPYAQVVCICKFNNMKNIPQETCQCGPFKQLVFIYMRWSLQ